ncbi:hypothetical protein CC78DRAFT_587729 [Lojkania enalia]|uniref:Uncharacterized protein n=1 Tax=Lojkania enalia TaxID=147567 RepID=A0A9P4MUK5_9PLEO|nr:hypothetical protein CC78DRAFT_587729 [Didymosphaeria enalia]
MTYSPERGIGVRVDKLASLNRSEANRLKKVPEEVGMGYVGMTEMQLTQTFDVQNMIHVMGDFSKSSELYQISSYDITVDIMLDIS